MISRSRFSYNITSERTLTYSESPKAERRMSTTTTKLFGKDLKEYDDVDIDSLLTKLTTEELEELNNEVDPDVSD